MKINLTEEAGRWQYADTKGRRVRIDITEPSTFATEQEAVEAAARHGLKVIDSRLVA